MEQKPKHKLIEEDTGAEVKPGMRILDFRNEIFEVVGFRMSGRIGSSGRVLVKKPGQEVIPGYEREYYPSVFGLKIVELENTGSDGNE